LKQYVSSDVRPSHIDAILDALAENIRVEVLYIQNFEWVSAGFILSSRRVSRIFRGRTARQLAPARCL
jgi:hypothetical protein